MRLLQPTAPPSRWRARAAAVLAAVALSGSLAFGVSACSGSSGGSSDAASADAPLGSAALAPQQSTKVADGAVDHAGSPGLLTEAVAVGQRAVVTTAEVTLAVSDVPAARRDVLSVTERFGGYVASESTQAQPTRDPATRQEQDVTTSTLGVRIPTSRTAAALVQLQQLGRVESLEQQTTDVTAKVADVDARVRSAAASVERVRALLASANTIGQVVSIEGELAQREATLESLQAQQRALADETSYSTVTVQLRATAAPAAAGESPTGFAAGLASGWDTFTGLAVAVLTALGWAVPFLAFALVVVGAAAVVAGYARRRNSSLT
jgi:hypothetical protein